MPTNRRASQALAHLRHMARLDISGPELIAPVVEALHALVSFDSSGYFYPDVDGELHAYMEHPTVQAAVSDHFDPRILESEAQVFHNVLRHSNDIARHPYGPRSLAQMLRVPAAGLLCSDYYNVVMHPAGVGDWLSLPLRTPAGLGIGMLFLFRSSGARPFSGAEQAALARLESCLTYVLRPVEPPYKADEVLREGLLVVTPQGRLQWISPEAEALMAMAFGWRWRGVGSKTLPHTLQLLIQRLRWPRVPAPDILLRNAHGRFHVRAAPLTAISGSDEAVALQVTQHIEPGTRMLAALRSLGLPLRQQELAWWLARGLSESQIAERMGISVNTVIYHRRQLYARMDVSNRDKLLVSLGLATDACPALR